MLLQPALRLRKVPGTDRIVGHSLITVVVGQLSASLTSFSRTIDDYSELAKKELNTTKQEKAYERVKNFRTELSDYRHSFDRLKKDRDDTVRTPWPLSKYGSVRTS